MYETEPGWGKCKEHGWLINMSVRLGVWKDFILVRNVKSAELGVNDAMFLVR